MVGAGGQFWGTIGGSSIEAAAIREAGTVLKDAQSRMLDFDLNGQDAGAKGMICGGEAAILLDYIAPNLENKDFASAWYQAVLRGETFFVLTQFQNKEGDCWVLGHAVFYQDGRLTGNCALDAAEIEDLRTELHNITAAAVFTVRDTQTLVVSERKVSTLYCCGAGHVAVPTAHIAALAGFRVVVLDDRAEYANEERFPEAFKIIVVNDFSHALDGLEIDKDSFIVIVTRGHKFDREVLEQSLSTCAGYIGMISSRRKKAALFEALVAKGVTQSSLDRVHSPIGLDIGGETPGEIAVSIVAELIQVRNKK